MKTLALFLINFYQVVLSFDKGLLAVLAPGGACRYQISCSEYTKEMIIKRGLLKGSWLGLKRIVSCNPILNLN